MAMPSGSPSPLHLTKKQFLLLVGKYLKGSVKLAIQSSCSSMEWIAAFKPLTSIALDTDLIYL